MEGNSGLLEMRCLSPAALLSLQLRQEPDSRPARASDSTGSTGAEAVADAQPEPRAEWGRPEGPDVSDSSSSSSLVSGAAQAPLSPGAAARRASSLQKRKVELRWCPQQQQQLRTGIPLEVRAGEQEPAKVRERVRGGRCFQRGACGGRRRHLHGPCDLGVIGRLSSVGCHELKRGRRTGLLSCCALCTAAVACIVKWLASGLGFGE